MSDQNRANSLLLAISLLAVAASTPSRAADPQPYDVTITGTGGGDIEETIDSSSLLQSLQETAPVSPFGLIERARGDVERIETALNSFGYYAPRVTITIDDHPLSDAALTSILDKTPADQRANVRVTIDRGPLYKLKTVTLDGKVPDDLTSALKLLPGDAAVASEIQAAQARLLVALQEHGYAFAAVNMPPALVNDETRTMDVAFKVEAGPQVAIGQIRLQGLKDVNESFVQGALTIHSGDRYNPGNIEAARQKLAGLGVFSAVSVRAADHANKDRTVDLVFDLQERPQHSVALSGSYSTDLGFSGSVTWSHHNLLGDAEQLNLSAAATDLGGSATTGIGYNFSAQFIKPRFMGDDQSLELDIAAIKQSLDAFDQTAETVGGFLRKKVSPNWSGSLGLTGTYDDVKQEGDTRIYQLVALPFAATYDSTGLKDPLPDPTKGMRASLSITPTFALGAVDVPFIIFQGSASTYFDLSGDGRSVLALRALAGSIKGASNFDLPPDQRLYAGGSGTVRGFAYQSIGPHFPDDKPTGATSVDAATIEFRQRIGADWGAATFVDAGQASTKSLPFEGEIEVGAGAGVRYYTSFGAIRADIAVPVTHVPGGDPFEIYIGLGQAF